MTNNQKLIESILNCKHEKGSFSKQDPFDVAYIIATAFYLIGTEKATALIETVRMLLLHGESLEIANTTAYTIVNSVYPEMNIKEASFITGLKPDEIKSMILSGNLESNEDTLKRDQIISLVFERLKSGGHLSKSNKTKH